MDHGKERLSREEKTRLNDFYFHKIENRGMCYAQVAKSPNDHQGADIPCKNKRVFITKLKLGLPPDTDTAAIGRSPGFCVTLLI